MNKVGDVRVLYDYQAFQMQKFGGVSRCFVELYKHLPKDIRAQFAVRESDNIYVQELDGVHPIGYAYENFICRNYFPGKGMLHVWYDKLTHGGYYPNGELNYSIKLLEGQEFDIFHPTFFSNYFLPYLGKKPFVLTIHDMIPELYPKQSLNDKFQIQMKKELAPLASVIVAVSENTKKDVIDILHVPEEKIHVIYHGCSFSQTNVSRISVNGQNPYILYVGQRKGYKRFDMFVQHATPFLNAHPDVVVICTGKDFDEQERMLFAECHVQSQFKHYWVSTDDDFFSLYHHALCFIYTSEYEGFGIPILEAYQADCPVLLNHASCFPEVAGDAAVYFHMDDKDSDLSEKLETIFSYSEKERQALLSKQRKRLTRYSWKKSAEQLANIYREIANR
ncbi:MAG: glycosyltransferase family 4 protein [Bacteroidaceae bacterium]|nr:glycosyltransferase family 4 protein [Bacteroidaceae bacterium]